MNKNKTIKPEKVLVPYRNSKNKRICDVTSDKRQAVIRINNCSTIIQSKDGSPLVFKEAKT